MAQRVRKITPEILKQIIVQEARKLQAESYYFDKDHPADIEAEEIDPDTGYADHLENKIDYMKALDIHEKRLRAKLAKIQEAKAKISRKSRY